MDYKDLHSKLEKYPHIQRRLDFDWGYSQGRKYLCELLTTDRPGRQGFSFDIVLVLQDLLDLHDETFPKFKPRPTTWDGITLR